MLSKPSSQSELADRARASSLDPDLIVEIADRHGVDPETLLNVLALARTGASQIRRSGFSEALAALIASPGVES